MLLNLQGQRQCTKHPVRTVCYTAEISCILPARASPPHDGKALAPGKVRCCYGHCQMIGAVPSKAHMRISTGNGGFDQRNQLWIIAVMPATIQLRFGWIISVISHIKDIP